MTKEEEKYTTLDTEQCKWWVNTLFGMAKEKACNSHIFDDAEEIQSAQDKIIKALEQLTINETMMHTLVAENEKLKADNKILAENCLKDLLALAIMDVPHGTCIAEGKEVDTVKPLPPAHKMCKDCAKSKILNDDFEGYSLVCSRFGRMAVNPDFYCADFEREDKDE